MQTKSVKPEDLVSDNHYWVYDLYNNKWLMRIYKVCNGTNGTKVLWSEVTQTYLPPVSNKILEILPVYKPTHIPEPPFEPGYYWTKNGNASKAWAIYYHHTKPRCLILGDKVEIPEKYR